MSTRPSERFFSNFYNHNTLNSCGESQVFWEGKNILSRGKKAVLSFYFWSFNGGVGIKAKFI